MLNIWRFFSTRSTVVTLGLLFGAIAPVITIEPLLAQTTPDNTVPAQSPTGTASFPDVTQDYWASPFIQALAQRNIITGYPDGSFRPEQSVQRAEFAAMIEKAFSQNPVRQYPSNGFSDVPGDYWAVSAIREAYETGFMSGYPGNQFLPNQQIPKVEAIVALANGLQLSGGNTANLTGLYTDANAIPNYAINPVASATQAGVVVNYPNVQQLNPLQPLTRAEAAAHLYQALVRAGQLQPLAANQPASRYIVGQTTATPGTGNNNNNIVAIATASGSFNTLTSLLQTAGLADSLQSPGSYTVFAPTDEAFAALPAGTLEQLQRPENRDALIRVLRYHVVPGSITSNQLSSGELRTFGDSSVNVTVDSSANQIRVNNAQVTQANVQASNGVIHVINSVLIPPGVELSQSPTPGTTNGVDPGRATRGGRSYVGVAGNIGVGGDTGLGEGSFAAISKIGLTRTLSLRPSAVFSGDTVFLVPITFDFAQRSTEAGGETFAISPYIGAGAAFEISDDADIGFLLTGGVDVPLGQRFTLNGAVNAAFMDDTDVGIMLGVGYNF